MRRVAFASPFAFTFAFAFAVALATFAVGCAPRVAPRSSSGGEARKTDRRTWVGTARNAKGGAVVITDGGESPYLEGLAAWPDDVVGTQVRVEGVLREKKYLPDPVIGLRGEISQGAEGMQQVIESPRWSKAAH